MAWQSERPGQFIIIRRVIRDVYKLAIEVDGTQYHQADSAQDQRDVMKDAVLDAIGLRLIRLSTAGSQEKERITQALATPSSAI